MIRASTRVEVLVQRLRLRAARLVAGQTRNRRPRPQRTDWHKPAALWPGLFGDPRDGK